MNLREGLRRTGLVFGALVTLFALAVYGTADAPSKSSIEWNHADKIIDFVYAAQTPEYRAATFRSSVREQIWGTRSNVDLIEAVCSKASSNGLVSYCAEYKKEVDELWLAWVKHIFFTLLVAAVASAVFGLAWWSFSWVLLGFTQPKKS